MGSRTAASLRAVGVWLGSVVLSAVLAGSLFAQGVTTGAMNGIVTDANGTPLEGVSVTAVHGPSGTSYRGITRDGGTYTILNMRVGGPYRVTAQIVGYRPGAQANITLSLAQTLRVDFQLTAQTVEVAGIDVTAERDPVMNADRTGAATFIDPNLAAVMPTIKRSTRDLTRLDPRSDGNFSFGGRNWLYNNISVDGSLFTNSFGLDDPSPGGQANAEPLPYDAVEQVQVSLAPFDVRQGGFTGASVNTVTRSGTNQFRGTAYTFRRSDAFEGNSVRGEAVTADPRLSYQQSGFSLGGPLQRDRLFFFFNAEIERTDNAGSDYVACTTTCGSATQPLGVSRVRRSTMDSIRQRMMTEYNYDPGPYEGYIHETNNDKLLLRVDWNVSANHTFMFRYSYLDARRDLGPHPFVLSPNGSGRAPSTTTLPFRNSGYTMNNNLNSFAVELNSRSEGWANRFFASYNRFRDHRDPYSEPFPTIDIAEGGVTYTTVGHEPFSIHNILDQNVLQLTNNFSLYRGRHTLTLGLNYERFSYFNSFNIFRHGVFFLPYGLFPGTSTFGSVGQFFAETDPNNTNQADFRSFIGSGPYKGEDINVGIFSLYAQDELLTSPRFNLTFGVRMDMPHYPTSITANPFSTGLTLLDENDQPETVDQARLPGSAMMLSPRIGFNWNARGDRATQVRGGTGVFTGRVPFVWIGNVYSNPGANPNVWGPFNTGVPQVPTGSPEDSSVLQQSFDLNAVDPDFRFPQVWTTDLAVDSRLPWNLLGTVEFIYSKDLNAIYMRNADLRAPVGTNPVDGRPFFGGCNFGSCPTGATSPELNPDGGAGVYVLDNTDEGYSYSLTFQLRRQFSPALSASLGYTYLQARNNLKSTEIASVLFSEQPNMGDPNRPELSYSEFGQRHRFVGTLTYARQWSARMRTQVGVYFELAEGNVFSNGAFGANRYSFRYAGDVNGDGVGGNDMMYVPASQSEIVFDTCTAGCGANTTPAQQWAAFDAFINQDSYLSSRRGQIAERFGLINPWYHNMDVRVLHDIGMSSGHRLQLSFDVLNFTNLLSSSMGVRKYANPRALSPLTLTGFDANGTPHFNFTGPSETFLDHPGVLSRWRMQFGLRYLFN
jgi:hypothetical protein